MRFFGLSKRVALFAAVLLALLLPVSVYPLEPIKEPILRIETGMHTAAINHIATDASNRYLATGSYDKTVRIWELSTGKLIRTLRPPIGDGEEGKIYAVAISPDGKTVAVGGWTGYEWDEFDSIYIFDLESGSLKKRIKQLPSNIFHLVYSKDGKYLAASLARDNGIRVYQTSNYSQVAIDGDYGSDTYGLDFDKDGRLATASYDGFVRIYDSNFGLLHKKMVPGGRQPYSVRFSPDGKSIAVGFNDSATVIVLSSEDIAPIFFPDVSGIDNGDLSKISWSYDGSFLYAGGRYASDGTNFILRWGDGGKGKRVSLPASSDTVMHIIPLKDGGIAYCSAEPAFGIFDLNGAKTLYKRSEIADLRTGHDGFLLSPDGSTVRFSYEGWGKAPAVFSASSRTLATDPQENETLQPPLLSAPGIEITDWEFSTAPKFNTIPIGLKQLEMSRSVAVSSAGESFLLGTEWYLRLYDSEGYETLEIPAPGIVWAVNIPQNGRLAAAAFGDGTIRWYELQNGYELLAFFPHADKKRWVLWSPSGYYQTSEGAEGIFGWHKNRGKDKEAEFLPSESYKKKYNRPDVIALVLGALSEEEALRIVGEQAETKVGRGGWRIIRKPPPTKRSKPRRRR